MRVISIPSTVSFVSRQNDGGLKEQEKPTPFLKWMELLVDIVKDFAVGPKGIKRALRVYDVLEAAEKNGASTLKLVEEDWEAIKRTVEEQTWTMPNGKRLLPYLEAVTGAPEEK